MSFNSDAMFIAQKLQFAEEKVAEEYGDFFLFGLFERQETPGRWDLVASAPWLETDRDGIGKLIALLRKNMDTGDWKVVSRVVPLDPSAEFVEWITTHYTLSHQVKEVYSGGFSDAAVGHAILITSNSSPSPARVAAEQTTAELVAA